MNVITKKPGGSMLSRCQLSPPLETLCARKIGTVFNLLNKFSGRLIIMLDALIFRFNISMIQLSP